MMPKMDSKQMAKLMQQMGIRTEEIDAERVVIEKTDGKRLIVDAPSVTLIDAKGQKSFQISGSVREEDEEEEKEKTGSVGAAEAEASESEESGESGDGGEDDAAVVAEQAGVTREEAQKALEAAGGDIAEAIMALEAKKKS